MKRCLLLLGLALLPSFAFSQSTDATISGGVTDPSGSFILDADVRIANDSTDIVYSARTNSSGMYLVPILPPGRYHVQVSKPGFKTIIKADVILNVQSAVALNFVLPVGATSESVTVDAASPPINTANASVSTVVDRDFVENIPLNGRSFQDLISMTPGVVTQSPQAGGSLQSEGDFSVNGQRTESNYYTIDGISGNVGPGYPNGYGQAGTTGSISASTALGTTQTLISVDALQEFRVSSSSYSAEYGRTPGGQFSLSSRAGTNILRGAIFEYIRNDLFDANDWFNNHDGVQKPALRQNDFGGTAGGPIIIPSLYDGASKTFFFVSYEGLRLVQPTNATTEYVPSLAVRSAAPPAMQALLNAFPVPTGPEIALTSGSMSGLSTFVKAYSLPSNIDSTSIRIDHHVSKSANLFFRYSYAPTGTSTRTLSSLAQQQENTETYTAGLDTALLQQISNSLRAGFSASRALQQISLDSFGDAAPVNLQNTLGVPGSYATYDFNPYIYIYGVGSSSINQFKSINSLRQWNITDAVALSLGRHQITLGIDERHLTSPLAPAAITVEPLYYTRSSMLSNSAAASLGKYDPSRPEFNEFSAFAQDEWHALPMLSVSFGLRWEINPAVGAADGKLPYTLLGDVANPASLTLAPLGTPLWKTTWFNLAPRIGVAWTAHREPHRETVLRAGGGVFFDTGNQLAASGFSALGFNASTLTTNASLPLPPSLFDFSTEVTAPYTSSVVYAFPRHLQLPYTLQWNVSLDQALGESQVLTLSYVGSDGRRLLQQQLIDVNSFNPQFGYIYYIPNALTSNYQALQVKVQRSVSPGLQALASYTWSHALDYGSTNASYPVTYGNADFDVRNNFQGGLAWDIRSPRANRPLAALANGWGLDGRINARTAFPVTLVGNYLTNSVGMYYYSGVNYDPAKPIYVYSSQDPGGRAINGGPAISPRSAAFSLPAGNAAGNAPRNFVRGFGAFQVNTAVRRNVHIHDNLSLLFRAEAFNVFNHPNFGYIDPTLTDLEFGQVTKMLNGSLGTMSSLYQQGGARSMQFSLKLSF